MKKGLDYKKMLLIPVVIVCCIASTRAAFFTRTVFAFQQYNTIGGATKTLDTGYVYLDDLEYSGVTAVTFTPINSSGSNVGSPMTVYDGFIGRLEHTVGKGGFVDLKFRNHSYSLSAGTVSGNVQWY